MDLKRILKTIKLHEQEISVFFGILIFIVAGIFIIRYVKNLKTETTPQNATTQNQNQTYTVKKGETLWSIAENYYKQGSDWKKIADANNITDPIKLEVGTKLVLPDLETSSPAPEKPSPTPQITKEAASTTNEIAGDNYTVVKGDSLWKIAIRAYGDGSKWTQIAMANKLHNPNIIHSGNVFIIPR